MQTVVLVSDEWATLKSADYLHIGDEDFGVDRVRRVEEFGAVVGQIS